MLALRIVEGVEYIAIAAAVIVVAAAVVVAALVSVVAVAGTAVVVAGGAVAAVDELAAGDRWHFAVVVGFLKSNRSTH